TRVPSSAASAWPATRMPSRLCAVSMLMANSSPSPAGREREGPIAKRWEGKGPCDLKAPFDSQWRRGPHPRRFAPHPLPASGRGAWVAMQVLEHCSPPPNSQQGCRAWRGRRFCGTLASFPPRPEGSMPKKVQLAVALSDYDHFRDFTSGKVEAEGIEI